MATLISDLYGADPSPFYHSRASSSSSGAGIQQQQQHHQHHNSHYQQQSRQPHDPMNQHLQQQHPASPPLSSSNSFSSPPRQHSGRADSSSVAAHSIIDTAREKNVSTGAVAVGVGNGAERIPTPPESTSPTSPQQTGDAVVIAQHMASTDNAACPAVSQPTTSFSSASSSSSTATDSTAVPTPSATRPPPPTNAIPSPVSDSSASAAQWPAAFHTGASSVSTPTSSILHPSIPSSATIPIVPTAPPLPQPEPRVQRTIMIRDLQHIESLTQADQAGLRGDSGSGGIVLTDGDTPLQDVKFEISAMPIGDVIEMVAALLTKITTTNDHQHDALHRNASHSRQAQAHNEGAVEETGSHGGHGTRHSSHGSPFSASVLAFHGKNVPAITIMSYLSRIHKYCPTTYEVFLSLLVYFDRMAERVNDLVMKQQQQREQQEMVQEQQRLLRSSSTAASKDAIMTDAADEDSVTVVADETDEGLADSSSDSNSCDDDDDGAAMASTTVNGQPTKTTAVAAAATTSSPGSSSPFDPHSLSATYFVVDSYNIHRLIISGVTCASKFFSDVFYTNARYAKVGGLPLAELNHLELQFLILNDFRLAIPIEDLEAYATMLVEFYAREVVGQRPRPSNASAAVASAAF